MNSQNLNVDRLATRVMFVSWVMCCAVMLTPSSARAEEPVVAGARAPSAAAGGFLAAPAVSEATLAEHRGAAATNTANEQQLNATVGSNSAINVTTGVNAITEGALGGSSGFPTVIQNSGNNVSIQNATIINLQLR